MNKIKKIGAGREAEIFLLEENKVLKLYFDSIPISRIEYEFKASKTVSDRFSHCPKTFEIIQEDGRNGIIFEFIEGKSLSQLSHENPTSIVEYSKISADLLVDLHNIEVEGLKDQINYYETRIGNNTLLMQDQKDKIIRYLKTLPRGNIICHGDFHVQNVLMDDNNKFIIDWANAHMGNQAADVAKALYIQRYSMGPEEWDMLKGRFFLRLLFTIGKIISAKAFIKQYLRKTSLSKSEIKEWELIVWALRLGENIPEETPILLKKIEKELKKLKNNKI